jgi:hypothetical protein
LVRAFRHYQVQLGEQMMPSTVINALFVISFFLPPAVVVVGLLFLAWPRRRQGASRATVKHAHAH